MVDGSVVEVAVVEVVVVEIVVTEVVAIDDCSAMGDVGVVIVNHRAAVPIVSPMTPAPTISSEKPEPESDAKSNAHSGQENPRLGIPSGICDDRRTVDEPRIVLRHVDHFGIGWFDDDGVALGRYLLLFIAVQMAGLVSLLTQCLDRIRDILLLIGVGIAKRRRPREILVHVFKTRGKLCESFYARVPVLFVYLFCQLFPFEAGMTLHPAVRLDNFGRIR